MRRSEGSANLNAQVARVAVVIPAFNEVDRLEQVLAVLQNSPAGWRLLVVDDGSTDGTAALARRDGRAELLRLPQNAGKGAAMWAGANQAEVEVLVFLDADLQGLTPAHVQLLAAPVVRGEAAMSIALFRHGRGRTDLSHVVAPWVSGQRAILRDHFLSLPEIRTSRHGVEALLTRAAREQHWRVRQLPWEGVSHTMKEEKLGLFRGLTARGMMYAQVARAFFSGT